MPEFFSSDGPYILQFLVIFLVILVLLMGAVLLFRRLAGRGLSLAAQKGNRARQPRLGIVDIYELDRQRQLILLRRDNVEHLLLVGGPNDVVVERNVIRGAGSRLPDETLMRQEPGFAPEAAPERAAVAEMHGGRPPVLPEPAAPPTFAMPVVVPPPLDPGLFALEAEPADRTSAPAAAARAGLSQLGRILRRTPPPLVEPRPEPASERLGGRERSAPEAGSPVPSPVPAPVPPSAAPARPAAEPVAVDADVLSDMTRQLETALRQQVSAEPARPEPAPPPPVQPAPERVIATAITRPGPSAAVPPPSEPAASPQPVAVAAALVAPTRAVAEPPVPPPEAHPAEAAALSVEEIETEFARLLGRSLDKKS